MPRDVIMEVKKYLNGLHIVKKNNVLIQFEKNTSGFLDMVLHSLLLLGIGSM